MKITYTKHMNYRWNQEEAYKQEEIQKYFLKHGLKTAKCVINLFATKVRNIPTFGANNFENEHNCNGEKISGLKNGWKPYWFRDY